MASRPFLVIFLILASSKSYSMECFIPKLKDKFENADKVITSYSCRCVYLTGEYHYFVSTRYAKTKIRLIEIMEDDIDLYVNDYVGKTLHFESSDHSNRDEILVSALEFLYQFTSPRGLTIRLAEYSPDYTFKVGEDQALHFLSEKWDGTASLKSG